MEPLVLSTIDIGAVEATVALAATGAAPPLWVLITGVSLLLLGVGAVVASRVRASRRR